MDVRFLGTGGRDGWPEPGCRVRLLPPRGRRPARPPRRSACWWTGGCASTPASRRAARRRATRSASCPAAGTSPARTGPAAGRPRAGCGARTRTVTKPYDLVVLDLLGFPAQLGSLAGPRPGPCRRAPRRSSAPITASPPSAELSRRAGLWRAIAPADGDVLSTAPGRARGRARPGRRPAGRAAAADPGPGRGALGQVAGGRAAAGRRAGRHLPGRRPVAGRRLDRGRRAAATPSGPSGSPPTRPGGRPGGRPWRAPTWPGRCAAWTGRC